MEVNYLKNTGIYRKIDELGRVVLPIEIRRSLNIDVTDSLEILLDGQDIIMRKHEDKCIFCGENKSLKTYNDKVICQKCLNELKTLAEKD